MNFLDFLSPETLRWIFSGVFLVLGWALRSLYGDVRDLAKEVENVKLNYVQKSDYKDDMREVKATLVRIETKIDAK